MDDDVPYGYFELENTREKSVTWEQWRAGGSTARAREGKGLSSPGELEGVEPEPDTAYSCPHSSRFDADGQANEHHLDWMTACPNACST